MKKGKTLLLFLSFLLLPLSMVGAPGENVRQRLLFNQDWSFHLGDIKGAESKTYDDSSWRKLSLPHDWAIEGEFSEDHPAGSGGGALPGGIGWYRKTFVATASMKGKRIYIDFDGVYMNAEVFINGVSLGIRPYGYISFRHDLTPYIIQGKENVLAVRVDNAEQPNSRWYSGAGIYRNVWLSITNPLHVDLWGTYVTTPLANAQKASVKADVTLKNTTTSVLKAEVVSYLLDATQKVVSQARVQNVSVTPQGVAVCSQLLHLDRPKLWTLEAPYLYSLRTEVKVGSKMVDVYDTPVGIRSFSFDSSQGFILNGERIKIKGVCMHHDLGCLGAAINVRAMERQLEILKEMGCNGIRCSHNPPAPELLDLCDRMGFVVMDETFDMWRKRKTTYDYSLYFNEWHERDLSDHILRDRNHPSIFMWSIGNEVLEQWTHADADTLDIKEANLLLNMKRDKKSLAADGKELSVNSLLTKKLVDMVKALDPTRPVTAGNNEPDPSNHLFRSGALDLIGFNYHETYFKDVPRNFPGKPFIVTESTSALMTRGYYRMPSDSMYIWPTRWDVPFHDDSYSCSSYDNCHAPWGTTHEESWKLVKNNDFISGMYLWTGFDYLGEPTPYWWPARSSYFGVIDLAGFPKDVYYMYQSEWTDKTVLHVFPHWNWQKGETVDLWAYYSNADEVDLFVNGKSCGIKKKEKDVYHVSWRVTFEPGTVRVVSRKNGKEVLSRELHTAGEPARIRLSADRNSIKADGVDLSFVTVDILDRDGNLCPHADNLVKFEVDGAAFVSGVDNGSPISSESFKKPERKAFYGKCLVVLQNNTAQGEITLKATSAGLQESALTLEAR